jgi:hypothetical protein
MRAGRFFAWSVLALGLYAGTPAASEDDEVVLGTNKWPMPTMFIARDYGANSVAADAKFKDRRMFIQGDPLRVSHEGATAEVLFHGYDQVRVRCLVAQPWPKVLGVVQPGQRLVMRGVVRGLFASGVRIEPCRPLRIVSPQGRSTVFR